MALAMKLKNVFGKRESHVLTKQEIEDFYKRHGHVPPYEAPEDRWWTTHLGDGKSVDHLMCELPVERLDSQIRKHIQKHVHYCLRKGDETNLKRLLHYNKFKVFWMLEELARREGVPISEVEERYWDVHNDFVEEISRKLVRKHRKIG